MWVDFSSLSLSLVPFFFFSSFVVPLAVTVILPSWHLRISHIYSFLLHSFFRLVLECHQVIRIPQYGSGTASLNVNVACNIVLYKFQHMNNRILQQQQQQQQHQDEEQGTL